MWEENDGQFYKNWNQIQFPLKQHKAVFVVAFKHRSHRGNTFEYGMVFKYITLNSVLQIADPLME